MEQVVNVVYVSQDFPKRKMQLFLHLLKNNSDDDDLEAKALKFVLPSALVNAMMILPF